MAVTNEDILLALRDVAATLTGRIDEVDAKLSMKIDGVAADVRALQADMTEVKHVVGANYLGLKGRVDQVADMMMDHIADYHGTEGRRRA